MNIYEYLSRDKASRDELASRGLPLLHTDARVRN
jgi:hypothetical protein